MAMKVKLLAWTTKGVFRLRPHRTDLSLHWKLICAIEQFTHLLIHTYNDSL